MLCLLFMKGDSIMQENQKTESFKLVLNLPTGKKTFSYQHIFHLRMVLKQLNGQKN